MLNLARLAVCRVIPAPEAQTPFKVYPDSVDNGHPGHVPRIDYLQVDGDDGTTLPPDGMILHPIHISGPEKERVALTFFADGCTLDNARQR